MASPGRASGSATIAPAVPPSRTARIAVVSAAKPGPGRRRVGSAVRWRCRAAVRNPRGASENRAASDSHPRTLT